MSSADDGEITQPRAITPEMRAELKRAAMARELEAAMVTCQDLRAERELLVRKYTKDNAALSAQLTALRSRVEMLEGANRMLTEQNRKLREKR